MFSSVTSVNYSIIKSQIMWMQWRNNHPATSEMRGGTERKRTLVRWSPHNASHLVALFWTRESRQLRKSRENLSFFPSYPAGGGQARSPPVLQSVTSRPRGLQSIKFWEDSPSCWKGASYALAVRESVQM